MVQPIGASHSSANWDAHMQSKFSGINLEPSNKLASGEFVLKHDANNMQTQNP